MNVQPGTRVLVNVAPFIGSVTRHKDSVPCEVVAIEGDQVHVRTESPYRPLSMWVASHWIEGPAKATCEFALNAE